MAVNDEIINKIYDLYWDDLDNSTLKLPTQINPVQFIIDLLKLNRDGGFSVYILLFNPNLWIELDVKDWKKILTKNKGVEKVKFLFENYGFLSDFIFMHRYLKVNPFHLFLENTSTLASEKIELITRAGHIADEFIFDETDEEEFQDGGYPNPNFYLSVTKKLKEQGMQDSFKKEEELSSYLSKALEKLKILEGKKGFL